VTVNAGRSFFKEEFATESDDKLILDGLAHMAMNLSENIGDFFGCLNKVNSIILDAYKSNTIMTPEPTPDVNGNISLAAIRAHNVAQKRTLQNFTSILCCTSDGFTSGHLPWNWTPLSDWPRSSFVPRRKLNPHPGFKLCSRNRMNSMGIYEIEMTIRGRKSLHPVTVVEDIKDNIFGIDFMHTHKLKYDTMSKQNNAYP